MLYGDIMIAEGTEINSMPKGFPGPDDETWLARMKFYGRPVNDQFQRYLMWVKYVAAPNQDTDYKLIMDQVGRLSGAREEDVAEAVESFRSSGKGNKDRAASD
jgi:hypothetical protein